MFLKILFILMLNFLIVSKSDAWESDEYFAWESDEYFVYLFILASAVLAGVCICKNTCCLESYPPQLREREDEDENNTQQPSNVTNTQQPTNQNDPPPAYDVALTMPRLNPTEYTTYLPGN